MRRRKRILTYVAAGFAALMLTVAVRAQYAQIRAVRGIVKFRDGEPVRGAAVQLKNLRTLQIRSYVTKNGGMYHFDGLSADIDYELRARYHDRFGPSKTLSRFNSRKEATVDLTIDGRR